MLTPDQIRRGFQAEARFFDRVNRDRSKYRPWWFIRAERASPLLDCRGIDGIAFVRRFFFFTKRIPLQLKTREIDMIRTVRGDQAVYVLTHAEMEDSYCMRNMIEQVSKARGIDFEKLITTNERAPVLLWEWRNINVIERNRQLYS